MRFVIGIAWILVLQPRFVEAQIAFEEVAQSSGISHHHQSIYDVGGGVVIFDFDNDGWEDVYLTGGEDQDKLYKNLGNGSFQDVSVSSGISSFSAINTFGAASGDIDNDGHRDLVITGIIGYQDVLLYNNGNGTFSELPLPNLGTDTWGTSVNLGDVNNDGLLDIYIGNYIYQTEVIMEDGQVVGFNHHCSPNRLYLNNGDLTFADVTTQYNVGDEGCALASMFSDFDGDNDPDMIVTNDFGEWVIPNGLYQNQFPTAGFTDVSTISGLNAGFYGMGVAEGDYDHDLDLDYYQTNLGINRLSRNDNGVFSDQTEFAGVKNDSLDGLNTTSWGCVFADFDNDSWPDLYVANGHIPAAAIIANVLLDPNKLFKNNGDGTFTDITDTATTGTTMKSRGVAVGDLNKDGLVDLVVNNIDDEDNPALVCLYSNQTQTNNHWLRLKLRGIQSNRDAFGANVRVVVGQDSWVQELNGGSSHVSQNSSIIHIGLGQSEMVDTIEVTFPSGIQRLLINTSADQTLEVVEDITISNSYLNNPESVQIIHSPLYNVLQFKLSANSMGSIEYINVLGQIVLTEKAPFQKGKNQHILSNNLSAGSYFIRLSTDDWQWRGGPLIIY